VVKRYYQAPVKYGSKKIGKKLRPTVVEPVAPRKPGRSPLVHPYEEELLKFFFDKIWPITTEYKNDWFKVLYKGGF